MRPIVLTPSLNNCGAFGSRLFWNLGTELPFRLFASPMGRTNLMTKPRVQYIPLCTLLFHTFLCVTAPFSILSYQLCQLSALFEAVAFGTIFSIAGSCRYFRSLRAVASFALSRISCVRVIGVHSCSTCVFAYSSGLMWFQMCPFQLPQLTRWRLLKIAVTCMWLPCRTPTPRATTLLPPFTLPSLCTTIPLTMTSFWCWNTPTIYDDVRII